MTVPIVPRTRRLWVSVLVFIAAGIAMADPGILNEKQDEEYEGMVFEDKWKESRVPLPAYPLERDLVALDSEAVASGYEYFVDRRSVRRDPDDVIRYTVVISSRAGARNVFFEGIRCATKEIKVYAYAVGKRGFRRMGASRWKDVYAEGPFGYRTLLADNLVCDRQGWAREVKQIRTALRTSKTSGGIRILRKDLDEASSGK